ncbi:MAG: hydrogenase 3 maturation endopeptidase HyCI [Phycisphaerae bacterium]
MPRPPARHQPSLNLRKRLEKARRIAVLAVGSTIRGDDAAGMLVADHLAELRAAPSDRLRIFRGETAPENLTGEIKAWKPTHLVIIDSADLGLAVGQATLIEPDDIRNARSFSTHGLPVVMIIRYLLEFLACKVTVIGIQPHCLEFGRPVHPDVAAAARRLAEEIHEAAG